MQLQNHFYLSWSTKPTLAKKLEVLITNDKYIVSVWQENFPVNVLIFNLCHRLEKAKSDLGKQENSCQQLILELEQMRALESKTSLENKEMRSKLEETCAERVKIETVCM